MITAGNYEGRAIRGKVQLGETSKGILQMAIDMDLFVKDNPDPIGQMTTFLYFSEGAAVYSYERLRVMGWKGSGADDIDKLDDIFEAKVPCRVTPPEAYTDNTGATKMGVSKLEILTGAGTVTLDKPLDAGTFKARLRALGGAGGASQGTPATPAGAKPPPF
jgi:hypothetical protein